MSLKDEEYSALFKAQVAMAALQKEASIAELSKRFGVPAELIEKWKRVVIAENAKKDESS